MTRHRRDRDRRTARRKPFRNPKPIILVVTEGKVTEPEYLRDLARSVRNSRVEIAIHHRHGVPRTLVEEARKAKKDRAREARKHGDDNLLYDQVWCVFDIDDHPGLNDARHMARDSGVELAISNPSFELWLLLHFRESPGISHRDKIRELLTEHLPEYDKHVDFALFAPTREKAETRAEQLDKRAKADGDDGRNPTTGVYRLSRAIAETA